jgi:predicted nucleic acid-binding protein
MNDKVFLDSNIILYAIGQDKYKKSIAINLLKKDPILSTQVLSEISNIMSGKLHMKLQEIFDILELLIKKSTIKIIDISTIKQALNISKIYRYSYYDSLIIASALENNCNILYTEDMQHSQFIENSLKILNPFK